MAKCTRIIVMVLVMWSLSAQVWAANKSLCESGKFVSVYIDPFFGGREYGPKIGDEYKAKDIVLTFGLKLKTLLEKQAIVACLSRDSDNSLGLDERLAKGKISQSKVYFAITISSKSKKCVNLYIPRESPRPRETKDIGLDTILKDITSDDKREKSYAST